MLPSEFSWLTILESCESTNTWALDHLSQLFHGDVVFTPNQTAGRGQFDRIWLSQPGILTASFILDLAIAQLSGFSLIAGLAVIRAIETLLSINSLQLKWTNDVLIEGRKLAGILCESRLNSDQARMVVGIGINLTATPESVTQAISLNQISSSIPNEKVLLTQLRHNLMELSKQSLTELLPELRSRDALIGKAIVFESNQETLTGEAAGIDESGQLLIHLSEGIRAFRSGRVLKFS